MSNQYRFEASGYSDDVSFMTGCEDCEDNDYFDDMLAAKWHALVYAGETIGRCRMRYNDGSWVFEAETNKQLIVGDCLEKGR